MSLETVRPVCDQQKTLNEACIKAAEPGDVLRDATIRGLHLRCFADRKSFYLYYRTRAGVERRPKLGDHGSISLAHARKLAKDMLQEVAAGNDPSQARADARAEPTLADLWDEYWKRHGSRKKSSDEDERIWEQYLAPLATKKLSHITYPMIADLHQKITDRPAPIQANRVLAMLSKMFSFGIRPLEWMSSNPATGVAKNRESKRKRYMKGGEAAAISALLQREAEANPASVAFLYLRGTSAIYLIGGAQDRPGGPGPGDPPPAGCHGRDRAAAPHLRHHHGHPGPQEALEQDSHRGRVPRPPPA